MRSWKRRDPADVVDVPSGGSDRVPLLQVEGLRKTYSRKRSDGKGLEDYVALKDATFELESGKVLTVIGPSGCGKTSLLWCIAGLAPYDTGTITVAGNIVDRPGPDRAVVFQQASLLPWNTVRGNVEYGLRLRRGLSRAALRERAEMAIEDVGLTDFAERYPHELSGGMQQRVNLARALATKAKLILMDEPFAAVDAFTKETLQDLLLRIVDEHDLSVLFVTHDIEEAVILGDEVLILRGSPGVAAGMTHVDLPRPRSREGQGSTDFYAVVRRLRREIVPPAPQPRKAAEDSGPPDVAEDNAPDGKQVTWAR